MTSGTSLDRFLCGTVNDFVTEVGRAYKRATENKQEAELMAWKVCCRGAGGLSQAGGTAPELGRGCSTGLCPCCACIGVCHAWGAQAWGVQVLGSIQALIVPREVLSSGGGQQLVPDAEWGRCPTVRHAE